MAKTNKIINKRLAPGLITLGISVTMLSGLVISVANEEIHDNHTTKEDKALFVSTYSVLWCLGMCMLLLPIIETYKDDYAFASHTAREFLKQAMKEHPEMKSFEKVLSNPRAIKAVATMIANSMHKSEQKQIIAIADKIQEATAHSRAEKVAITKQAHAEIVKIIQEHASTHPEFINEVLITMARADTTYVLPTQQYVR